MLSVARPGWSDGRLAGTSSRAVSVAQGLVVSLHQRQRRYECWRHSISDNLLRSSMERTTIRQGRRSAARVSSYAIRWATSMYGLTGLSGS